MDSINNTSESTTCAACGEKAPHVDNVCHWCDDCHIAYESACLSILDMEDKIANGASHMES